MSELRGLVLLSLLSLLLVCSYLDTCNATRNHDRRVRIEPIAASNKKKASHRHHPPPKPSPSPSPKPSPSPSPSPPPSPEGSMFNVLDYGARGNGVTDDTKAFQVAWAAACKVKASTVVVPPSLTFLVGPISFAGPTCQPNIVFQLDGTIIAPTNPKPWGSGLLQWLEFTKLTGITVQGSGIIEGQGSAWWSNTNPHLDDDHHSVINDELDGNMPHTRPTALRFYGSNNVTVAGITIRNSPQCHLKFDSCQSVDVFNVTVSSPGDSPNTDGIHLQNSVNVAIHNSNLGCGDDCISIQTGCSNVYIHDVNCGPGHGISIGGLGSQKTKACVSNITVHGVNFNNTTTGVRIKTWQGGSGSVTNIRYSNIQVTEVETPIMIDQFYCDKSSCKNQSSAVALSGISYTNIIGTYTVQPVHLACSDSIPCSDISLADIVLKPLPSHDQIYGPFCWEAYGELYNPMIPPIDCLRTEKSSIHQFTDPDSC